MTELSKAYQPEEIEKRWYAQWEQDGMFSADPGTDKKPYSIVLPPPNVTGALHMGHALNHSLQDALIRRARMQGFEALWVPGTDHAGIATQNVVERDLRKEGLSRHDLGREAFVERVWEWKHEYGDRITKQMRELGESCDWGRERFTMDEGLSRAVRTVFIRWFEDGLVYRGLRVINWCPQCQTALSDIEVEHEDVAGELVTFRYDLSDGSGSISVATTRIETMLGDTGVFVHPDDERYAALIGKTVRHPFFPDRELPIVADEAVDPEFGTGAVKGTPAHDPVDFEMSERAGTEKINIFDETAHVNENGGRFAGMDRYEARGAVYEALDELGLIEGKPVRPYVHAVGHCYRSGTEIEPWLSEQWFVKMRPLAEPAIEAAKDGRVRFHPPRFAKAYLSWMENLRDWCISRQLWWGHRIPVWYCDDCGETIAALEDPAECKCGSSSLRQDPDVLDTWFSSQLWPFSTLGWPDDTPDLATFYPTSVMVTAYEIIYLWVARMIMSGMYFMDGQVPFADVFIHGIVRDSEGKKMSKSIGNVIDPLEMIERYGADALRFSLAFIAVPGNDSNSSEERIEGARNFANKLWNASRFVLMSLGDERPEIAPDLLVEDRWILSRLDETIAVVGRELDAFNFSEALHALHSFVWSELCDWYVEMAKPRLREGGAAAAGGVLVHCLDRVLRLLHPVMPFVTEELWSKLRPGAGSIMTAAWPEPEGRRDTAAEESVARFQDLVVALRRLKIEHDVPQGRRVPVAVAAGESAAGLEPLLDQVASLARLESIELVDDLGPAGANPRAITPGGIEAAMRLGETIDPALERQRLERKRDELVGEVTRAEKKLSNESFVAKAPAPVVEKERGKLDEARAALAKVEGQLGALGAGRFGERPEPRG